MSLGTTKSDAPEAFQEDDGALLMVNYTESSSTSSRATGVTPQYALTDDTGADARISCPYLGSTATTTVHTSTRNSLHDGYNNSYLVHEIWGNFSSDDVYSTPVARMSGQLVPPRLPKLAYIPLPPLSPNVPVQTHALITYHPHISPICWALSLPPSTARLAITTIGNINSQWLYDAAIVPTTLPSITIRIRDIERPLVVFPIETGNPIRIVDVLNAVYSAVCVAATGHRGVAGNTSNYDRLGVWPPRDVATENAIVADVIGRRFRNRVWWNGLSPSTSEVDVWVLQLQSASRGRFPA